MADNFDFKDAAGSTKTSSAKDIGSGVLSPKVTVLAADAETSVSNGLYVDAAGTKVTAATIPTGGVGFLGWISAIWYQLTQTLSTNIAQVAGSTIAQGHGVAATAIRVELPTDGTGQVVNAAGANSIGTVGLNAGVNYIGNVDANGTKVTAATIPTGGVGFLGWLSAIWFQLTQTLAGNITQVAGASIAQGHGVAATAIRVELPTDGTGQVVNATGTNSIGTVGLNTGTNAIGTVDATGTKVTAASLPTGGVGFLGWISAVYYQLTQNIAANITQVAGATIAQGHGTAATAVRVELPTDGTGTVGLNAGSNYIGNVDANGTKVTAATIPTGGVGFLGWLSAIWYQLTQLITVNITQIGSTAFALGARVSTSSISVVPSTDQDPIYDIANGIKTSALTTNATLITTGSGHTFLRIDSDTTIFVTTDGSTAAADNSTSIRIIANVPEIIPVPPSTAIKGFAATSAVVRCMPMKVR